MTLRTPEQIAREKFGCVSRLDINNRVRKLWRGSRRKKNPIPCKMNGTRREYYLEWFDQPDNIEKERMMLRFIT